MLDQNTDRMWYVIGAVLVGAAIILIANNTMPEIFASVSSSFDEVAKGAVGDVGNITPKKKGNLINIMEVTRGKWVAVPGDEVLQEVQFGALQTHGNGARHSVTGYMRINGGMEYMFTSEVPQINKRIAYYDKDKKFIDGFIQSGSSESAKMVAPDNAEYARISSEHMNRKENKYIPVSTWWFGLVQM